MIRHTNQSPGGPTARHYSPSSFDSPSSVSLPTIVRAPAPGARLEAAVPKDTKVKKKPKCTSAPPPDKEYLNQEEAAYIMGVSVSFLNKDRHYAKRDGRPPIVPFTRVGKKSIRIKQSDVHAYMASRMVGK